MHGAGFQGRGEVAKLLIVHGLDPSDVHSDGYTPLHRSCWGGEQRHTEMARVLLEAGVPHDQKATDGKKPIEMVRNDTPNLTPAPTPTLTLTPSLTLPGAQQQGYDQAAQAVGGEGAPVLPAQGGAHGV